ncbi:unnamed protein product [Adineta steineri]|uniref:Uncharacterized protein n=1 Tax=Adineta steineri TaxID=433720 RepID=A0A819XAZ1_9BILA|nr:unnamed protein product [Adineta steineri]CAF4138170.1 unnamed protein product [Adineta steineri]
MKYQRVLYTNKFTSELKSKLRILCYDKRRSLRGNVYYVGFATDADIAHAERVSKRLHNITLKPFQSRSVNKDHSSTSHTSFLSPPTTLSFLPDNESSSMTARSESLRRANETLEERAMRILGPRILKHQSVTITPTVINLGSDVNVIKNPSTSNIKNKEQLIDNIQSCLQAIRTARGVADEVCQLYRRGSDCRTVLKHFFQVHSTAFYLKASTSAQIKIALTNGVRLTWSDVSKSFDAFRADVHHEQLFMTELTSARHILAKIDCATSIAMSSKLAYQLTKLAN